MIWFCLLHFCVHSIYFLFCNIIKTEYCFVESHIKNDTVLGRKSEAQRMYKCIQKGEVGTKIIDLRLLCIVILNMQKFQTFKVFNQV